MDNQQSWHHEGTGLKERLQHLDALDTTAFLLDEKTIPEHLSFLYDLSKRLHYFNLEGKVDQELDWSHFLNKDISVQLARIATVSMTGIDFKASRKNYERYQRAKDTKPLEVCVGIIQLILEYAGEVHRWGLEVDNDLISHDIRNTIQKELSQDLFRLNSLLDNSTAEFATLKTLLSDNYNIDVKSFFSSLILELPFWGLDPNTEQQILSSISSPGQPFEEVSKIYLTFEKNISRLSKSSAAKFQQSLTSPDHLPQMGLMLAFLQMWKSHIQADLNNFTQRHLDFYYRRVLKMKLRGAQPDSVHVYFKASPDVTEYILPEGSQLFAGKDSQEQDIFYKTLADTPVLPAEVDSIKSVLVENPSTEDYGRLLVNTIQNKELEKNPPTSGWAPFGDATKDEEAKVGLVIASPMFYLLEGKRRITVGLHFDPESTKKFAERLVITRALQRAGAANLLTVLGTQEDTNILKSAFLIYLSTAKGWLPISENALLPFEINDNSIKIRFRLPQTAPSIVAFPEEANPESYDTPFPQLRILLRTEIPIENGLSYGILKDLILQKVDIGVKVEGVKKLSVQNDFGPLDPTQSFQPFGASPERGSNFYIGSNEVFYKPLSQFSLQLEWGGLPADKLGLGEYYKDYDTRWIKDKTITERPTFHTAFANDKYQLSISQLISRNWNVRLQDEVKHLFQPDNSKLNPITGISFDNFQSPPLPDDWNEKLPDPLLLTPDSLGGFIKLQLKKKGDEEFNDLFGHLRYPLALADVVSYNSQQQAIAAQKVAGKVEGTASGEVKGKLSPSNLSGKLSGPFSGKARVNIPFGTGKISVDVPISGTATGNVQGTGSTGSVKGNVSGPVKGNVSGKVVESTEEEATPADLPKPPYTPVLKSISLNYEANITISDLSPSANRLPSTLVHIYPFGTSSPSSIAPTEATSAQQGLDIYFFPHFHFRGNLIIGLANLTPPVVLSLLFLIEEGSHEQDGEPERIQWSYLSGNNWLRFEEKEVLQDNTQRFTTSGTVLLQIPAIPNGPNEILPDNLYWIQASIIPNDDFSDSNDRQRLGRFSKLRHLFTNGVRAIRTADSPDFKGHLKAGTIEKLLPKSAQINEVIQPDPSFGGRLAEKDSHFYIRVAESLRHKMRAIVPWDFERIILEAFPQIFKVKCINHSRRETQPDGSYELVFSPGNVIIVVIPQYQKWGDDVFVGPRASQELLQSISTYLEPYTSSLISIQVINPIYEEIQVSLWLKMIPGKNTGANLKELETSLNGLLSPWVFPGDSEIEFGREIATSAVLGAIRQKDYVASINNYRFSVEAAGEIILEATGGENTIIRPSKPWSVLVSSSKHTIFTLSALKQKGTEAFFGIPFLTIGEDFSVAPDEEGEEGGEKFFQEQLKAKMKDPADKSSGPALKPFIYFRKP